MPSAGTRGAALPARSGEAGAARVPPQRSPLWAQTPLRHTARVRSGAHRPLSGTDRPEGRAGCGASPRGWLRISVGARSGSAPGRAVGAPEERGGSGRGVRARGGRVGTTRLPQPGGSGTCEPRILTAPTALARLWNLRRSGGSLDGGRSGPGERPRRAAPRPSRDPGPLPAAPRCPGDGGRSWSAPQGWSATCPALRAGVSGRPRSYRATDSFGEKNSFLDPPGFLPSLCFLGDRLWLPAGLTRGGGGIVSHTVRSGTAGRSAPAGAPRPAQHLP